MCKQQYFDFQDHNGRKVVAAFDGGYLSSDGGGALLFRELELRTATIRRLAGCFHDERNPDFASRPYDILTSFVLTTLIDGSRFAHVNRLREDPLLKELFGLERMVGDDTIRRYFKAIEGSAAGDWIAQATQPMWRCLPERFILDWDSTVQTRYGSQEGAEVGYNPHKRGRPSHHPLLAVVAGTRLCPYYR